MIRLSQGWVLYLLIFLIVPFLLSVRSYVWGLYGYSFLNRTNIDVLKGISMTWIVFYSICNQLTCPTLITDLISKSGILGVTLFLFVCGFEVMTRYLKHPCYLKGFLIHQVIRIVCIFLGCNVMGALVHIFMGGHDTLKDVLYYTVKFQFMNETSASLVGTLLYFYLAFYISYKTKFRLQSLWYFSLIFVGISLLFKWEYSLAFCFFIGVFCAKYKKYLFRLLRQYLRILFIISLFLFTSSYLLYIKDFRFIFPFIPYLFLGLMVCILMKLQLRSTVFKLIGVGAIELYLVHELLLILFFRYSGPRSGLILVLFWIIAIMLGLLIRRHSFRFFA